MPNISWNGIRHRALLFSRSWEHATSEQADKQTFWNDFFDIFGISRRTVATFETPVKRLSGNTGFIDLLWPEVPDRAQDGRHSFSRNGSSV